ncbi:D-alanine-D-alanine ligase [Pelagirhabdus alkalitolerans]|uniref:acylphosphatase n=1 Tax=Pelagirhabdus alkalitolerans TaxID=1612202 RepID=A0A1G6GGV6_9BACI|nr:D-alanine-D-alanine ligase [Pelagirhabdus alkalitolerans]
MKDDILGNWPNQLINAIPMQGFRYKLSGVSIALEGWRRGLNLKFYRLDDSENKFKLRFYLSNDKRTHHFEASKGDMTTAEADKICDDKFLTKKYLKKAGVPVAEGNIFNKNDTNSDIMNYCKELGFPLVVKPLNANGGKGVFSNIQTPVDLLTAITTVRDELNYNKVMVERYIEGEEYRIVVLDNEVVGVLNRIPANVIGNGHDSIRKLIRDKNNKRKSNPHLSNLKIKIDKDVKSVLYSQNLDLKSVPELNQAVALKLTSNLSTGGDSVDLTDDIPDQLKEIAINATNAIPGLPLSGIDVMVNKSKNEYKVIEVNTKPGLGGHLFPFYGQSRDIPKKIIDYYFPETQGIQRSFFYFNIEQIYEILKSRSAKEISITPCPTGEFHKKEFIIHGKVQKVGYRVAVTNKAKKMNIHGSIKNLEDNTVQVVACADSTDKLNEFKKLCYEGLNRAKVTSISEYEYPYPVPIGFNIETRDEERAYLNLQEEKEYYQKKYEQIESSKVWKVTSPVRISLDYIKDRIKRIRRIV